MSSLGDPKPTVKKVMGDQTAAHAMIRKKYAFMKLDRTLVPDEFSGSASNVRRGDGFLKLLYRHEANTNTFVQMEPMFVLDFYVVQEKQRLGIGKRLMDYMLQDIMEVPESMAIDGPNANFIMFMKRHYEINLFANYLKVPSDSFDRHLGATRAGPAAASGHPGESPEPAGGLRMAPPTRKAVPPSFW